MSKKGLGYSREDIIKQVVNKETHVKNYREYVPVLGAVSKIWKWSLQDAEIIYLTSRKKEEEIDDIKFVLKNFNFPDGILEFRKDNEQYKDVAEKVMPDVLIEDDCENIGWEAEMVYPHIRADLKTKIKSIIIKEFSGIDDLPDSVENLKNKINYAFIDGQNLNMNIRNQGWILDYKKFIIYLKEKYGIKKAFIFIGFVESNKKLYDFLSRVGYVCIFKPTLEYKDGTTKGNCDAEVVLQTMLEINNFYKAVLVTGDGDFFCIAKHLIEKNKLQSILIPNKFKFSALLKFRQLRPFLRYMNDLRQKLEYKKEKAP